MCNTFMVIKAGDRLSIIDWPIRAKLRECGSLRRQRARPMLPRDGAAAGGWHLCPVSRHQALGPREWGRSVDGAVQKGTVMIGLARAALAFSAIFSAGVPWSVALAAVVNGSAELSMALTRATGGETIELAPGNYGILEIKSRRFSRPVIIRSANPARRAKIADTTIRDSAGIRFVQVDFANPLTKNEPKHIPAVRIYGSERMSFEGVKVSGSLDNNPTNDGYGINVTDSKTITITDSEFTQLARCIVFSRSQTIEVARNRFHDIRTDAIDVSQSKFVKLTGNRIWNFTPIKDDHPDGIQFFTNGTAAASTDILIADNLIIGSHAGQMQGIFLRAEPKFPFPYQRVTIRNNVLFGTMWNGIMLDTAAHATIADNLLVTLPGTAIRKTFIRLRAVEDLVLRGNISPDYEMEQMGSDIHQSANKTVETSVAAGKAAIAQWDAGRPLGGGAK